MKARVLILMTLIFSGFYEPVFTQEKYAILISGDRPDREPTPPGYELYNRWWASWNDTYLMWEMLVYEKGFDNDNVFVLWADGTDWSLTLGHNIAQDYDPQQEHWIDFPNPGDQITDYSATLQNVEDIFTNLSTGASGLPQITEDDFLFIWAYGRNTNPG